MIELVSYFASKKPVGAKASIGIRSVPGPLSIALSRNPPTPLFSLLQPFQSTSALVRAQNAVNCVLKNHNCVA